MKMMMQSDRPWSASRSWPLYRVLLLLGAGCMLLMASLLPWLKDPLGQNAMAWKLPIDLAWQLRTGILNYGLLCLCCTGVILLGTLTTWRVEHKQAEATHERDQIRGTDLAHHYKFLAMLSLIPSLLFLYQYLFTDMQSIAELTRTTLQLIHIQSHYGYHAAPVFIPIIPTNFHALGLGDRFTLIIDELGPGFFLPLASFVMLLTAHALLPRKVKSLREYKLVKEYSRTRVAIISLITFLLIILLGRGPTALAMNYEAEHLLGDGSYSNVQKWLDYAVMFNPALDTVPEFHMERGQAWYYLHPTQPNVDSQAYLANYYDQQNDSLTSYQTIADAWNRYPHTQWLEDQYDQSLTQLVELTKPLVGTLETRINSEDPALGWLDTLVQVEPSNIYAQYMIGRILYDFQDYSGSEAHMRSILNLTQNTEVLSSAYTYLSLNQTGLGHPLAAREYLFIAQDYDPAYRNNTAREEISGMR